MLLPQSREKRRQLLSFAIAKGAVGRTVFRGFKRSAVALFSPFRPPNPSPDAPMTPVPLISQVRLRSRMRANFRRFVVFGTDRPFSHWLQAPRVTPIRSARTAWVIPERFRPFAIRC